MIWQKFAGYGLIYLCALLDWVPWRDTGHWYFPGLVGCRLGPAHKGFKLLPEVER